MKFKTKNGLFLKTVISISLMLSLNAEETINSNELYSFTVQKYRVDFNAQTDKSKSDIMQDYLQTIKLSDAILKSDFKDNLDYQIANRLLSINLWAQKVMNDETVSDETLKELFKKHSPKIEARYLIRNILLKNKDDAIETEKALLNTNKTKRLEKFEQLVQSNSEDFITRKDLGKSGWIDESKLSPAIRDALKDKKQNDIINVYVDNIGWQVLLLEDSQPEKQATFEEAKEILTKLAKEEILSKRIERNLK
jgi:parvulin-like peptidyl-prolyl isomerase